MYLIYKGLLVVVKTGSFLKKKIKKIRKHCIKVLN